MAADSKRNAATDSPPVLGSWGAWYALVLLVLLLVIAGFAVLSRVYG